MAQVSAKTLAQFLSACDMKTPVLAIIYPTVFWLSYSLSDRQIAAAVVRASYTGVLN